MSYDYWASMHSKLIDGEESPEKYRLYKTAPSTFAAYAAALWRFILASEPGQFATVPAVQDLLKMQVLQPEWPTEQVAPELFARAAIMSYEAHFFVAPLKFFAPEELAVQEHRELGMFLTVLHSGSTPLCGALSLEKDKSPDEVELLKGVGELVCLPVSWPPSGYRHFKVIWGKVEEQNG